MFGGSAAGQLGPCYVVYKGQNVYPNWTENGPPNATYSATPSGWFDGFTYCDYLKGFAAWVKRKRAPGKLVLTCDNLRTHLTVDAIKICEDNDIELVCFPPNSTDKMQPLDVAFFRSLKAHWRNMLRDYQSANPSFKSLAKTDFPRLLAELIGKLETADLLKNGFRKCGLYPLNPEEVMVKIPHREDTETIARGVDQVLIDKLETRRFGDAAKKRPRGKGVPAGASLTTYQAGESSEEEEDSSSNGEEDGSSSGGEEDGSSSGGEEDGSRVDSDKSDTEEVDKRKEAESGDAGGSKGQTVLVVAVYEGEWFVAEKVKDQAGVQDTHVRLSYMSPRGKNIFCWPDKCDVLDTDREDVLVKHVSIEPVNSRGHFRLKDKDFQKVKTLMVMVFSSKKVMRILTVFTSTGKNSEDPHHFLYENTITIF